MIDEPRLIKALDRAFDNGVIKKTVNPVITLGYIVSRGDYPKFSTFVELEEGITLVKRWVKT